MSSQSNQRLGLFPYFDGDRDRYGDALVIQFRLQAACPGGDINKLDELLDAIVPPAPPVEGDEAPPAEQAAVGETKSSIAAMIQLSPIIAAGFDLPPFDESDGTGLLVQERINLLIGFYASQAAELGSASALVSDEATEAPAPLDDQAAA